MWPGLWAAWGREPKTDCTRRRSKYSRSDGGSIPPTSTIDQYHIAEACPVCSRNLPRHLQEEVSEPNIREREGLQARLHDINATMEEIANEQNTLREDECNLTQETKRITSIINADLNPQLKRLQKAIKEYRAVISLQAE